MFHASRAALVGRGLYAKTHTGQHTQSTAEFGPAPTVGRLLKLRIDADYGAGEFGEIEARLRSLVEEATAFVERCRGLVVDGSW